MFQSRLIHQRGFQNQADLQRARGSLVNFDGNFGFDNTAGRHKSTESMNIPIKPYFAPGIQSNRIYDQVKNW